MGRQFVQGFLDVAKKEIALEAHIAGNFYPPLPAYVRASIRDGFKQYWAGELSIEDLQEKCYLKDLDALYRLFYDFLNDEHKGD